MGINETVKLIITLAIGCLLLYAGQTVLDWREGAQQNEQRGRTMTATSGILQDGAKATEDRQDTSAGVAAGKEQFDKDIEEGQRNEPATRNRASTAVPTSVRDAFRKRRLARERLGCVGDRCDSRPPEDGASKR